MSLEAAARRTARKSLGKTGRFLYSLAFWPYLALSCAVLFVPAVLIWLVTFPWDKRRRALEWYMARWAAHYLEWAPLAGATAEGLSRIRKDGRYVFVVNHQSMVDILAVYTTRLHFKWVSKIENFYAPFLGWTMVLNRDVPLRRHHLPSILRMIRTSSARLREGSSLCIFPEGTRSEDGNLRSFYRGAFFLAAKNRIPVVPIVIDGTHELLPKGRATVSPRPVRVRILDPIDPASVDWDSRRLRDLVRARMTEELARMRAGE